MAKESVNVLRSAVVVLSEGLDFNSSVIKFSAKKMLQAARWADESDVKDKDVQLSFSDELTLAYSILRESDRQDLTVSSNKIAEIEEMLNKETQISEFFDNIFNS